MYNLVNGNIENANIKTGAAIDIAKINLAILSQTIDASASTWTDLGEVTTVDINGGTVDGTNIGATTPGTVAASTLKVGTTNQGDILYDNGTSLVRLTPGTSGQFLKTQGAAANPVWAGLNSMEVFTTTGEWICPTGVNSALVMASGAGGGGAGGNATQSGGGGGSGAYLATPAALRFVPGNSYTMTIGAGGNGGSQANNGADGGPTSIEHADGTLSLDFGDGGAAPTTYTGGTGGASSSASTTAGINGVSGGAGGGRTPAVSAGSAGGDGLNGSPFTGGGGAGNPYGKGGAGGGNDTAGSAATGYGSGGGGSGAKGSGATGGAGASGVIYIWYNVDGAPD